MQDKVIYQGQVWRILAVQQGGGACPFENAFRDQLTRNQQNDLIALLEKFADVKWLNNREKFKKIEGQLWEFKHFQVRVPCFTAPNRTMVLTHAFIKKGDKLPKSEIARAWSLMNEWKKGRQA